MMGGMTRAIIEIAERGQVTIPKAMRDEHGIEKGQKFTILDLGGVFVLNPGVSQVDSCVDRLREDLIPEGASLEAMLAELRARRESC
jgi:bifunctional DNA-binding transcriptional regulator/antitoxin component of YhaV-PrlF toxin-antitoxin module